MQQYQSYKILVIMQEHIIHSRKNTKTLKRPYIANNGTFPQARLARMHTAMQRYIDSGWAPGLVTLVHRHGHEHVESMGTMAFNSNMPMRRDTIFRLASMTKPVTAVGAMTLVEECR